MAYEKEARTAFAHKALELSALFMIKFGQRAFAGTPTRALHVQPPEESTGGGKQAREPIALVPAGGAPGGSLVVGWMDVGENIAELRSWRVLAAMHQQRFGQALDLPQAEYDAFVEEARRFFTEEAIPLRVVDDVPVPPRQRTATDAQVTAPGTSAAGISPALILGLAFAMAALGVGLGWLLFAPK